MNEAVAFIDTNTLIHYQFPSEVDWPQLLRSDSVLIVVAQAVLGELSDIKDTPGSGRSPKRKRVSSVIQRLSRLAEAESEAMLRPGVKLVFETRDPTIDFSDVGLNKDRSDNWLLASIIQYKQSRPDTHPMLITHDLGLELKARGRGIQTLRLPDALKLPAEPDPEQVRLRELERENRLLKQRLPRLELRFVDGSEHAAFELSRPARIPRESMLTDIRARYQKMSVPRADILTLPALLGISLSDIQRYNNELDDFYERYADYLREWSVFRELIVLQFDLEVNNRGTGPADGTRITLDFPAEIDVYDAETLPAPPTSPQPPSGPGSRSLTGLLARYPLPGNSALVDALSRLTPPGNVSAPQICSAGARRVIMEIRSVLHNVAEGLSPLFVVFKSFEQAHSFRVIYELIAANLPQKREGHLDIEIRKEA